MKRILSMGLLAWTTANAAELGSISLTSVSGEPLRAQIPIILSQGESLEQLSAAIIETKPAVADVTLTLSEGSAPHINIMSQAPITGERLTLTLQITDALEDTEYHYDLALGAPAKNTAPSGKPFVYGPVKAGDTLWQVASLFAKHYHLTPDQAMVALYEHNKKAFRKGNQNQLMAGSYLKLPNNIGKVLTPKHAAVRFKPTEVISQAHPSVMLPPEEAIEAAAAQVAQTTPTVIPEFPQMEEGKQVAVNLTSTLPGVPTLKLLNPLTDANTALFSNTLNTVLGAEDTAFVKLLDKMQQDLKTAREAIDLERQAKQALQSQVGDLQIQLRALTELVSLQQSQVKAPHMDLGDGGSWSLPSLSIGGLNASGNNPIVLLMAAIAMASLFMYAWDHFSRPKPLTVKADATPAPRTAAAVKAQSLKPKYTLPSLAEVDQCIHHGRYFQAQEMLGHILSKQPGDYDALYKLCQVYVKSDNQAAFEMKLGHISARWRTMYPQRYQRLESLYQRAWGASAMVAHDPGEPVYEGDPPSDPVQTKLDLARAYIDIGDQSSAYEILGEVLKEGTPSQVLSAQVLMSQIKP
ncbi:MAG: FimV family protein [Gammaproteobacteria bacterium]